MRVVASLGGELGCGARKGWGQVVKSGKYEYHYMSFPLSRFEIRFKILYLYFTKTRNQSQSAIVNSSTISTNHFFTQSATLLLYQSAISLLYLFLPPSNAAFYVSKLGFPKGVPIFKGPKMTYMRQSY